jgi:hypothetical protein
VMESEGMGDDGGGGLEDERAQGGDPCGADGESEDQRSPGIRLPRSRV